MQPFDTDFLIVGQGLAGSVLAWTLAQRGRRVHVLDDSQRGSASRVAAGMINPLAGMRFTRPAGVEAWLDSADVLYRALEAALDRSLLHKLPMLRLLRSAEQRRFYERQADDPASAPYLGDAFAPGQSGYRLGDPHGGFHQYRTGYLDTGALLDGLADWLAARQALTQTAIDSSTLSFHPGGVELAGVRARQLVFCEGWRMRDNPWFDWLPLAPAKGEILTLGPSADKPDRIVAGHRWLLPLVDGGCKLGATVSHAPLDTDPTRDGRDTLIADYRKLLPEAAEPTVTAHQAGVRPNTRDRQPLLGRHLQHPELVVFNGFGGRGSLTIPWHAERLADHLLDGTPLPPAADIARCARP